MSEEKKDSLEKPSEVAKDLTTDVDKKVLTDEDKGKLIAGLVCLLALCLTALWIAHDRWYDPMNQEATWYELSRNVCKSPKAKEEFLKLDLSKNGISFFEKRRIEKILIDERLAESAESCRRRAETCDERINKKP
jgi:hypothetical protein